jgi:hypothetical protein
MKNLSDLYTGIHRLIDDMFVFLRIHMEADERDTIYPSARYWLLLARRLSLDRKIRVFPFTHSAY